MNHEELWSQIRRGVKEGIHYTVQKTEELTRIVRETRSGAPGAIADIDCGSLTIVYFYEYDLSRRVP